MGCRSKNDKIDESIGWGYGCERGSGRNFLGRTNRFPRQRA
jgi:hypothetical protein